jgi:uncharacterized protein (TIGR02147 family)
MEPELFPEDPRTYLKSELELRQLRRPQYSLRAFARDLNMSPSALSDFLQGKLGLSKEKVRLVSAKLNLTEAQQEHLLDLLEARFARTEELRKVARWRAEQRIKDQPGRISLEQYRAISNWYHMAIPELLELDESFQDPKVLAKALGISTLAVKRALQILEEIGLLDFKNGHYLVKSNSSVIGDETPNEAIRQTHSEILSLAQQSIEKLSMHERENVSVFLTIKNEDYLELQKQLRKAITNVLHRFAAKEGKKDRLYCYTSHLFPIGK